MRLLSCTCTLHSRQGISWDGPLCLLWLHGDSDVSTIGHKSSPSPPQRAPGTECKWLRFRSQRHSAWVPRTSARTFWNDNEGFTFMSNPDRNACPYVGTSQQYTVNVVRRAHTHPRCQEHNGRHHSSQKTRSSSRPCPSLTRCILTSQFYV